jgi:succinate-semialdehyde dehydrogenase/glutarate-semialdehyde dehydrogenase
MYINGRWSTTGKKLVVNNPSSGESVGELYVSGKEETQIAIHSAKQAFSSWSTLTAEERSVYLYQIAEKIEAKKETFAQLITKEMGKTIQNARGEVMTAAKFFRWYAEEAKRVYGDQIPASAPNKRISVIRQPVGVVGAIIPWNFPLSMGARKLGPALAVGCTVVLKPSKEAPLSSIELCKVFEEIGLPEGVVNVLVGDSSVIVGEWMNSSDIRKISFTGSTEVGKKLIKQSADTVKRVSMELGGHAPFIVFEDADLDLAVEGLIQSKYASAGQQCISANRVYVHDSVYQEFSTKFKDRVEGMVVGDGMNEATHVGPLIHKSALDKVHDQVENAMMQGAELLCGGRMLTGTPYDHGSFYAPTILGNVKEGMKIVHEETFGPVAPLIRFTTEEEVIQRANEIEYGLASYFYTNDLSRMYRVSEKLEYGMIGVNDPFPNTVQAPFGGMKESGLGREGGKYGLDDYLEDKLISVIIK